MSARNRVLYYRPLRGSTVAVGLSAATAWRRLTEDGQLRLDVKNLVDSPGGSAGSPEDDLASALKKLKRVSARGRTFYEEQGVHVIHVALGWLHWVDEERSRLSGDETVDLPGGRKGVIVRSPLVLLPVDLSLQPQAATVTLNEMESIGPNPSLIHAAAERNVKLDLNLEDEMTLDAVMDAWERAIQGRQHWRVDRDGPVYLDTFSFKKIAIVRELERSLQEIADQPVLAAMCGESDLLAGEPGLGEYSDLDKHYPVDDLALVVPADSSQLETVLAASSGTSLVVQGPPGTGKSQTITNLVATFLARRKRVLFVAEKRAARDIVVENLRREHLGEHVLHVTSEVKPSTGSREAKRDVLEDLRETLERGPGQYLTDDAGSEFDAARQPLNRYARALRSPLSSQPHSSPYDYLNEWAATDRSLAVTIPEAPTASVVTPEWKRGAYEHAAMVDDLGTKGLDAARSPWANTSLRSVDQQIQLELRDALEAIIELPKSVEELVNSLVMPWAEKADDWTPDILRERAGFLDKIHTYEAERRSLLAKVRPGFWKRRWATRAYYRAGGKFTGHEADVANQLREAQQRAESGWRLVRRALGLPTLLGELRQLVSAGRALELLESLPLLRHAASLRAIRDGAAQFGLDGALLRIAQHCSPTQSVRATLEASCSTKWAAEALASDPVFRSSAQARQRQIERFGKADQRIRVADRSGALSGFAATRPGRSLPAARDTQLGKLLAQITARRRRPLRWTFAHCPEPILALKPCLVTSPLAVAQFLSANEYRFDVVIFDEASQIRTEDVALAMSKGRQTTILGDSQQMPPTDFFDMAVSGGDNDTVDFESVLLDAEALLPAKRLLWHYRSQDERLIAFSNYWFYHDLFTFPSAWDENPALGVKFEYVENAIYGRGGSRANPQEAERVIDVLQRELSTGDDDEVAITAMSVAQQSEIEARIEQRAESSSLIQSWVDAGGQVKNLETVQGDERDIMILSFGYGRDASGTLQLNFGPLSRENGYRRLNVAVTRARKKTIVVSSIRASDIPPVGVGQGGLWVRKYLDYADRGPVALSGSPIASGIDVYESPFEEDVARAVRGRGWIVDTQVGVGRYRVDLGVRDPGEPGRYLLGIECDGATYHSARAARDRDIVRAEVLGRLGWELERVWSPDWFRDSEEVLERIEQRLRNLMEAPGPNHQSSREEPAADAPPRFHTNQHGLPSGTTVYSAHVDQDPEGRSVDEHLAEIVRLEGPLHIDELFAALRDDYVYGRIGRSLRAVFENALLVAEGRSAVRVRGNSVWAPDVDTASVLVKVNVREGDRRKPEHYSDEELIAAMRLVKQNLGAANEELPKSTARFLGYSATTYWITRLQQLLRGL